MIRKWVIVPFAVAGVLLLVIGASGVRPPITYNITDLGTLGGPTSTALGINDQGQIVGSADTEEGYRHAYLWQEGHMTDLGTLGMIHQTEAWGINNVGQVVGIASNDGGIGRSFLWENGQMTELGDPAVPKSAYDINDAGQVVGIHVSVDFVDGHAFLYDLNTGVMTDLGTLGGSRSIAWGIDEVGRVVGSSFTGSGERAFLWEDGTMISLGNLGLGGSEAFAINDQTVVVGWSQSATSGKYYQAFRWEEGTMTDLGGPAGFDSSRAEGVNDAGQVVGMPGFLYDPVHGMLKLEDLLPPSSGWGGLDPRDINDKGQIVGSGFGPNGRHAFLMTPGPWIPTVSDYGLVVMTLLLLIVGTILIARQRARV